MVSQKTNTLNFSSYDRNVGKCRPIFKICSHTDSQRNSLCSCYKILRLTLTVLLHYFAKLKKI